LISYFNRDFPVLTSRHSLNKNDDVPPSLVSKLLPNLLRTLKPKNLKKIQTNLGFQWLSIAGEVASLPVDECLTKLSRLGATAAVGRKQSHDAARLHEYVQHCFHFLQNRLRTDLQHRHTHRRTQ